MNGFVVVIEKAGGRDQDSGFRVRGTGTVERMLGPIVLPDVGKAKVHTGAGIAVGVYDHFYALPERMMYEDERLLVVCDAEIYNYREFTDKRSWEELSEAKIIADLFKRHGSEWYKDVQGVFSAFIWDKKDREGYAFADRIGTKPVRYYESSDSVVIASSIKSIAAYPGFNEELDYQGIFLYISMEMIPTPYTIYKNVKKLESGHVLKVAGGRVQEPEMVWKMEYADNKITDEEELKARIYELTREAVRLQTSYRNDPDKIGCFLSGGTDSSTIAGLMNELYPGKAKTFSIGFDEPGYDEMYYARIAVKAFNTKHTEYYVTVDDIIDSLPKIVNELDEPFANSSISPAYFCSRLAYEKGIKTMLGGDGGDEIFGGNARYYKHFADFQRIPPLFVHLMKPFFDYLPSWANKSIIRKMNNYVKRAGGGLADIIQAYDLIRYVDPDAVFEKSMLSKEKYRTARDMTQTYLDQSNTVDQLDRYLYHDLKITLMDNDLPKVNRMTQLAGTNIRYPFLYPKLVDFTGLIPPGLKVNEGKLRYIFKKAFGQLLPDEIINKTKHGFGLPIVPWMLRPGKLNDILTDVLFDTRTSNRGIFRKSFLEKFYKQSQTDKTTFYGTYLYYVLILELWLREHFDYQ